MRGGRTGRGTPTFCFRTRLRCLPTADAHVALIGRNLPFSTTSGIGILIQDPSVHMHRNENRPRSLMNLKEAAARRYRVLDNVEVSCAATDILSLMLQLNPCYISLSLFPSLLLVLLDVRHIRTWSAYRCHEGDIRRLFFDDLHDHVLSHEGHDIKSVSDVNGSSNLQSC